MITCTTVFPGHSMYDTVSLFAREQYRERLHAVIEAKPDFFAYAHQGEEILGCVGVMISTPEKPCLIEGYVEDVFSRIAGTQVPASTCAEIGTRAVLKHEGIHSVHLSVALTATALIQAYRVGIRYIAYTATREVRLISRPLEFNEESFGPPNLSGKDVPFLKNWEKFFELRQTCYGFTIYDTTPYYHALQKFSHTGIKMSI